VNPVSRPPVHRLFLVAGEASGDACGAGLIRALRERGPSLEFAGLGGPLMRGLDDGIEDWIAEAAVVGLWEVLRRYPFFRRAFHRTLDRIAAFSPGVVVTIDYPGFNLRLARALRRRGYRGRLVHYVSPQVWAWNRGRMPELARLFDRMLCIFPFEAELWAPHGIDAVFVGHPMVERLGPQRTGEPRDPGLVALLPGSRSREVEKILPVMAEAAALLARGHPGLRFKVAAANERLAARARALTAGTPSCEVVTGGAHALMRTAAAGMVASGTATLESAFFGLPYALVYRVSPLTYEVGRRLVRVPHLGMVNLLAGREIVPEFIQDQAEPGRIAEALSGLLSDPVRRETMQRAFEEQIARLGGDGASARAAEAVLAR